MTFLIVILLALVLLVLAVAIAPSLRQRGALRASARVVSTPITDEVDDAARRARRRALEPVESELLERRIQLDGRRGALGGDTVVFDAIERLEGRLRVGDITEEEFEAEKIRLLSGG